MTEYILEAYNLEFSYLDGTKALKGLNIRIEKGKKIALVGNNRAGKTTLFLHLTGYTVPIKVK